MLVFIDDEDAAEAVAYLMLFGAVYLFGQIGAYVLKTGASLLMLGPLDHLGGAVFGFVKGVIVVQVLLVIFAAYPSLDLDSAVADSHVARRIVDDYGIVRHIVPGNIDDRFDDLSSPLTSRRMAARPHNAVNCTGLQRFKRLLV